MNKPLTQDALKQYVRYEPDTGYFYRGNCPVGSLDQNGYFKIYVLGKMYYAHRLAWLYIYGEWPVPMLDHINRNPADNRIINLRIADHWENSQNRIPKPLTTNSHRVREREKARAISHEQRAAGSKAS